MKLQERFSTLPVAAFTECSGPYAISKSLNSASTTKDDREVRKNWNKQKRTNQKKKRK